MSELNIDAMLPLHVNGFGGDFKVVARLEPHGVAISTRGERCNEIDAASFIVTAVNAHAELLAALSESAAIMKRLQDGGHLHQTTDGLYAAFQNAREKADAAISKSRSTP